MFKTLIDAAKANKQNIIRTSLVIGGTVVGLALTAGLISKATGGGEILVVDATN